MTSRAFAARRACTPPHPRPIPGAAHGAGGVQRRRGACKSPGSGGCACACACNRRAKRAPPPRQSVLHSGVKQDGGVRVPPRSSPTSRCSRKMARPTSSCCDGREVTGSCSTWVRPRGGHPGYVDPGYVDAITHDIGKLNCSTPGCREQHVVQFSLSMQHGSSHFRPQSLF